MPEFSDADRLAFVGGARELLTANDGGPVPFRHQGRTRRGIDCIGTLVWAARRAGMPIQDRTDYGRMPADRKLREALELHFGPPVYGRVRPAQLQPADVVQMAWGVAGEAHVGVVGDHPHGVSIIHAHASSQRVIEQRIDELIARRITGVYRP